MSTNLNVLAGSQQATEFQHEILSQQNVEQSPEVKNEALSAWEGLERQIREDYESLNQDTITKDALDSNKHRLNELQQIYDKVLQQDPQNAIDFKARLDFIKEHIEKMSNALNALQERQLANPVQTALGIWEGLEAQINADYTTFLTNKNDVNLLLSISNLSELQKIYEQTYQSDQSKALELKPRLDFLEKRIQEMNMSSEQMTPYDLKAIASFSTKPIEDTYTDENGTSYYQPDHSQLLSFGSTFFMLGEYAAIGLLRQKKIQNKICDILYLSKQEDQINFETPSRFSRFLPRRNASEIEARQQQQQRLLDQAKEQLKQQIIDWNYDKFEFPSPRKLERSGFDPNYVNINHVLILYYKKKEVKNIDETNNTSGIYD